MPTKKVVKKKFAVKKKTDDIHISLPEGPTEISDNLEEYTWMIYGERKIGKTTLLSKFNNALFLMFDPLNKGLPIKQVYIPSWNHFKKILVALEKKMQSNPNYCNMIIIDTGYMAYERCYQYMIKKLGIQNPQDKAWGSAWKEIAREFMEMHDVIFSLDVGFAVTAHSNIIDIQRRDGTSYSKLTTQLGSQAFKFYNGLVDVIAFYQYNKHNKRELTIVGDSLVEAGNRIDEHFEYTDGTSIHTIPMGNNAKDAYKYLLKAFNNELTKEIVTKKAVKKKTPIKKR